MNRPDAIRRLQALLFLLVLALTFEGLLRKAASAGVKPLLFFAKDIIVLGIAVQLLRMRLPGAIRFLAKAYAMVAVLMIPVIVATAIHDPLLAVFGVKQYLLFPVVGLAVFVAFEQGGWPDIFRFFRWTALLLIPTTLIAILQSRLPADHWLNLSVTGTSLEGFSAGDRLRVSSTFPFVAQYCMFLNAQIFICAIPLSQSEGISRFWKIVGLTLLPLLVIGSYITGSRGAVVGNLAILLLACGLAMLKRRSGVGLRMVGLVAGVALAFIAVKHYFPEVFVAYGTREEGKLVGFSSEVQDRTLGALFGWAYNPLAPPSLFGYGLGVMSNGSDTLSRYAAGWRRDGAWTETDAATTFFEGGFYLMLVWYGFRFFVIFRVVRNFLRHSRGAAALAGAFGTAYVLIIGVTATLGIQPPVAIWWWMAVGISLAISLKPAGAAQDESAPREPPPGAPAPLPLRRGRSAYAEQLHSGGPS